MTLFSLLLLALFPQVSAKESLERAFLGAQSVVQQLTEHDRSPAFGLALRVGDEIRTYAWGFADVADQLEATPDTRFRLASVSKCLTGSLAALLWEEGKLDLDAPIQKYLPEFPLHEEGTITARLLGGHLSGIPHYGLEDRFEYGTYHAVRDGLRVFAHRPLEQAPGAQFLYSSYGFNLLGAVVESAGETEFRALMRARIFTPLGMEDILAEHPGDDLGPAAALYETVLGKTVEVPRDDIAYKWPSGGFVAAPRDMMRFARVFDPNGPVLSTKTRALMCTAQRTTSGKRTGYSLGLSIGDDKGRLTLAHSGSQTGAKSMLLIYPEQRIAVALFANHSGSGIGDANAATQAAKLLVQEVEAQAAGGSPAKE